MSKTNTGRLSARNAIFGIIVTAYLCRLLSNGSSVFSFLGFLRSVLYIGLFAAWGFSLNRRVVQKKVKRYLIFVVVLLIFWNVLKTLKYLVVTEPIICRYLWYLYYAPMLLIPLLVFLAGWLMGKPDDCKLPYGLWFLWIPTILLILLVLTNDLHQQVFRFAFGHNILTFVNVVRPLIPVICLIVYGGFISLVFKLSDFLRAIFALYSVFCIWPHVKV